MAKKGLGVSWGENEIRHINILEMKTIKFGVLTYCKRSKMKHAVIMPDNTTAIAYINKKAGLKSSSILPRKFGPGVLVATYIQEQHIT